MGASTKWSTVTVGFWHTCATRISGALWCWGYNFAGQVGDGTTTDRHHPRRVGTAASWESVSAAAAHTCALTTNGTRWCWGANWHGQIGDGTLTDRHSPKRVGKTRRWVSVHAGDTHTCTTRANGALRCWGRNDDGRLGDGTLTDRHHPTRVGTDTDWAAYCGRLRLHRCAGRLTGVPERAARSSWTMREDLRPRSRGSRYSPWSAAVPYRQAARRVSRGPLFRAPPE